MRLEFFTRHLPGLLALDMDAPRQNLFYNDAMAQVFCGFIAVQALLVVAGWIAALARIENIVWMGPLLSVTGILLTITAWLRGHPLGIAYGMGVPALSTICFLLINSLQWSPGDAYLPVNSIIAAFALGNTVLCGFVVREVVHGAARFPTKFQFHIGGIMLLTTLIAISFGLQRALGWTGIAIAMLLWQGAIVYWFTAGSRSRRVESVREEKPLPEFPLPEYIKQNA